MYSGPKSQVQKSAFGKIPLSPLKSFLKIGREARVEAHLPRVHQHLIWLLATSYGSQRQAHRFPLAEVQSTQRLVDDSRVLDASADECKTASSLVIAVVPLWEKHTHARTLPHISSFATAFL